MIPRLLRTRRGVLQYAPTKPLQNEKGIALLLVLLVIALLVAMVVEFDYRTRIDLRAAGNLRDGLQAAYLAKSGIASAQAILKDDQQRNPGSTDLTALWAVPLPPIPLGEGTVSVKITDEASKFNINNLAKQTIAVPGVPTSIDYAKELFRLAQVDPNLIEGIVDSIADWVDSDDLVTQPSGAEEDYYQRLPKPYHCKNKPMDSLSELHLVKGMTDDIYQKVSPYLTVSSSGQINVNTADSIVLQALGFDEEAVKQLMDRRPLPSTGELLNLFKGEAASNVVIRLTSQGLLTVKSDIFSIEARGKVQDMEKTAFATLMRQGGVVRIMTWRME
jgi:general secretion pathway protein K